MIETQQMKVEDFLVIMAQNRDIYPEFDNLPEESQRYLANINIITGQAESLFENGRLIAVGGIRYVGVGEGWFLTPPNIRENKRLLLFKEIKGAFIRMRDEHNLWRIFAESKISTNFLEHLGYEPHPKCFVWTRQ